MSGPENNFIASVHKHLPPMNEFYRMKNHNVYNGGIADCWYSGARDLWIEYKFVVLPKRDETIIDITKSTGKTGPMLSVLQQEWIRGRLKEGRQVWVIVGFKEGGVVFHGTEWSGKHCTAGDYRIWTQSRVDIAKSIHRACS